MKSFRPHAQRPPACLKWCERWHCWKKSLPFTGNGGNRALAWLSWHRTLPPLPPPPPPPPPTHTPPPPSTSPSSATSRGATNAAAASTDAATDASAAAAVTNAAAAHASAKAERAAKALHDSEARELLSQIRAAEAKYRPVSGSSDAVDPLPELTDGDLDRFKDFFRISRNQIGWKVSISHMTLMDVTPAERVLPFDCTLMPVARCLPGAYVYAPSPYALSVQVNVAPVAMLLEKMKESLDSGCSWRFQKDIVRLRAVSHALWMQLHTLAYSSDPKGGGGGDGKYFFIFFYPPFKHLSNGDAA